MLAVSSTWLAVPNVLEHQCSPRGKPPAALSSLCHLQTMFDWAYRVIQEGSLREILSFTFKAIAVLNAIAFTSPVLLTAPYSRTPLTHLIHVPYSHMLFTLLRNSDLVSFVYKHPYAAINLRTSHTTFKSSTQPQDNSTDDPLVTVNLHQLIHSLTSTLLKLKMRFNAVIAATILAATVSGAAIPNPAPEAVAEAIPEEITAETTEAPIETPDEEVYYYVYEDDSVSKREAEAAPGGGFRWSPAFRPVGLPVGKREAEAEAAPGGGFRWSPAFRPVGLPVGKREAEAEAKAAPGGGFRWSPAFRPVGLPVGK